MSNNNSNFVKELENLINKYNMESGSDTPDFMLANYLMECLENYNNVLKCREKWYGRGLKSYGDGSPQPLEIGTEAGWSSSDTKCKKDDCSGDMYPCDKTMD